jgi:hypothetical protein
MSYNAISNALECFGGTEQTRQAIRNDSEIAYIAKLFATASGGKRFDIIRQLEAEQDPQNLLRVSHDVVREQRYKHENTIVYSGTVNELYSGLFKLKFLKCRTCDKVIHITSRTESQNDLKNFISPCGHSKGQTDRGYSPIKTIDALAYLGQTNQSVESTYVATA